MILLVFMALVGAGMGAWIKPRLLAVPLAISAVEGARGLIGISAPAAVGLGSAPASIVLGVIEDPVDDYLPLLVVSGGAALIAAVMGMILDKRATDAAAARAPPRRLKAQKGLVRADGMAEPRDVRAKAEQRQKAILGL